MATLNAVKLCLMIPLRVVLCFILLCLQHYHKSFYYNYITTASYYNCQVKAVLIAVLLQYCCSSITLIITLTAASYLSCIVHVCSVLYCGHYCCYCCCYELTYKHAHSNTHMCARTKRHIKLFCVIQTL